ncbi:MAG: FAD:protein FMN transferase [Candidatus Solibacter usitatus]|nr:FAD:protein FMN transferase [Candidatus Solibacter usitatus]
MSSQNRKWFKAAPALAMLIAVGWAISPDRRSSATLRLQWQVMGTLWTAEIVHQGQPEQANAALNAVMAELRRIDELMSEWRPESPVSAINDHAGRGLVEVPTELRELVERAVGYSERSGGVFDITWRGMGRIWRFDDEFRVPSPAEVSAAKSRVGYRGIRIEGNRVGLARAGMSIGLGGIAKGYALDRCGAVLRAKGFDNWLLDGGGDVLVSGARNGAPWSLGIQHPRKERGALLGRVSLSHGALITSGDYERFRIVDGVRYHHIIDPRSGWPATASRSVTVLADSAEAGVVLAKVIFIYGPERASKENVEALVVDKDGRCHARPPFQCAAVLP